MNICRLIDEETAKRYSDDIVGTIKRLSDENKRLFNENKKLKNQIKNNLTYHNGKDTQNHFAGGWGSGYFCTVNDERLFIEFYLMNENYPEFFVCIDKNKNRYLVLLENFVNDEYIITPISSNQLIEMICGEISVKDCFKTKCIIYSVKTSKISTCDDVSEISFNEVDDIKGLFGKENLYLDRKHLKNSDEYISKLML